MSQKGYSYHIPQEETTATALEVDPPLPPTEQIASASEITITASESPTPPLQPGGEAPSTALAPPNLTPSLVNLPVSEISPQKPVTSASSPQLTRQLLLWILLRRSAVWVGAGISTMLAGIGIAQVAILSRLYVCPPGATCPGSINPTATGNALPLLQTLMQYWLQVGTMIAGFGLVRLSAYQSWFIMMRHGNTIENLDLNLGAIKGSPLDTVRLLLKKGNRWLSTFALGQIAIGAAISLIISLSITKATGHSIQVLNTDGQLTAIAKLVSWALANDTSHGIEKQFQGTLVFSDGRSNSSVNAQPRGPRISGDIYCAGVTNHSIRPDSANGVRYEITADNHTFVANPTYALAVSMTTTGTASTRYLWVSNTNGILPNATQTEDGRMFITLCNHTISMANISVKEGTGIQYINPNMPEVKGCKSDDESVCAADSVNNAIVSWWGGIGQSLWQVSCRGGVVGPLNPLRENPQCALNATLWSATATSMLDALIQTSPLDGNDFQNLTAIVETRNGKRWWLQGLIPLCTLILYGATLYYTLELSQGNNTLKELSLTEVIGAAQTDYIRGLVDSGQLKKSPVRYGSDVGFVSKIERSTVGS